VEGEAAADRSGVASAHELLRFTDALVGTDDAALARARAELEKALGPAALVDAAAVASNFERMVRIADATGIPIDGPMAALSGGLRDELELGRFAGAESTPASSATQRMLARLAWPLLRRWISLMARRNRARA
jgi:hypothetical protein